MFYIKQVLLLLLDKYSFYFITKKKGLSGQITVTKEA